MRATGARASARPRRKRVPGRGAGVWVSTQRSLVQLTAPNSSRITGQPNIHITAIPDAASRNSTQQHPGQGLTRTVS
ncbi:hypothetical protein XAC3824_690087 [Xanthomonas citri pv. citri]|nr:hypothetical protein XAC3824_690087 [Xanthomonas citri pv. citri]CEE34516.1 hypothetical protein XAC1083_530264 [Xanthomonas citri pv. citri]CEE47494.1 hypothetical protein XAC908_780056 [Xanthomonas citri pv. citri]CEE53265.1 hypothetical protein XAC3608_1110248 [Xanthomonas citri pv. citri]CEF37962.1 hypothetical protein XAC40_790027 [Xanthomonas citri pv. citri]